MVEEILKQMGCDTPLSVTQFLCQEDGEPYRVWKVQLANGTFVLKEAKEYEHELYLKFFKEPRAYHPALYHSCILDGKTYLLMEYIPGQDLQKCSRPSLIRALDSLIAMQQDYWNDENAANIGLTFDQSLENRRNRRDYLLDPQLEAAYDLFLEEYASIPKALCHDDLLPFNVIDTGNR